MLIGIDFDNTIVCYDRLFHALARERGLIPDDVPANKTAVRDYLRAAGREDDWTALQGVAYGPEIVRADPFPGVLEFFRECRRRGIPTAVVSHKTRYPYRGRRHDLHKAARRYLSARGFLGEATGLGDDNVFFELSKEAKLARIGAAGCTHFIDDLPEFLAEAEFPTGIERILFDPERRQPDDLRWRRMASWIDAPALFDFRRREATEAEAADERGRTQVPADSAIADLLAVAGVSPTGFKLDPIAGGGNNRGFKLTAADGRAFFLKWYFRHPDDPRDRLGTEFAFTNFCWRHDIRDVPQPLARGDAAGLALYEYVDGRRPTPGEIDAAAVDAAVAFYRRLNEHRGDRDAKQLPDASEACFSIQEHVERIGGRVQRLVEAAGMPDAEPEFREFVVEKLAVAWSEVYERIDRRYPIEAAGRTRAVSQETRRLSPSDFGFHNALRDADGRYRFIDLEYAGWDGTTKLIGDFFCQVQVPVSRDHWGRFVEGVIADQRWPAEASRRAAALLPAYRIKWCCIVLNVFLPIGSARRAFGTAQPPTAERRAAQLHKAREVLNQLTQDWTL